MTLKPERRARIVQQVVTLGAIFRQSCGRAASTVEELQAWAASPKGQTALTPYLDSDGKIDPDHDQFQRDTATTETACERMMGGRRIANNSDFLRDGGVFKPED
jgi:hypothetical protein